MINRAIDFGINCLESACAYSGSETYYGIFLASIECEGIEQLEENLTFAARFKPMPGKQIKTLIEKVKPFARQLMYYKP